MPDPSGTERTAASTFPPERWAELAEDAPDGLAVLDPAGRFLHINRAGRELCGGTADSLIGAPAPFLPVKSCDTEPLGLFDDGLAEQVTTWSPAPGVHREFAYRAHRLSIRPLVQRGRVPGRDRRTARQRRVAAIARTAAKLASEGSLTGLLDALASEVLKTDELAGVQILTVDEAGGGNCASSGRPGSTTGRTSSTAGEAAGGGGAPADARACANRQAGRRPEPLEAIREDPAWESAARVPRAS